MNRKVLILAGLACLSSNSTLAQDQFLDLHNFEEKKHKSISYYRELAERETSITNAAIAVRKRLDAGVKLNDNGTWDVTPVAPSRLTPALPTVNKETDSSIEVEGLIFSEPLQPHNNPTSLKRVVGNKAYIESNNRIMPYMVGDKLDNGDVVSKVTLNKVSLIGFDGTEKEIVRDF